MIYIRDQRKINIIYTFHYKLVFWNLAWQLFTANGPSFVYILYILLYEYIYIIVAHNIPDADRDSVKHEYIASSLSSVTFKIYITRASNSIKHYLHFFFKRIISFRTVYVYNLWSRRMNETFQTRDVLVVTVSNINSLGMFNFGIILSVIEMNCVNKIFYFETFMFIHST